MRSILAIAAASALTACAADGTFQIPTPGSIIGGDTTQTRLAQFCEADFVEMPAAALGEWVALYNLVAPVIEREPIDTNELTAHEAVAQLLAARAALCIAAQPAPMARP